MESRQQNLLAKLHISTGYGTSVAFRATCSKQHALNSVTTGPMQHTTSTVRKQDCGIMTDRMLYQFIGILGISGNGEQNQFNNG